MKRTRSLLNANNTVRKPATLADLMQISLLVHQDGLIWVFHDKPMPDELEWVDYDADEDKIYFIGKRGIPMELGLRMKPNLKKDLIKCKFLMANYVINSEIKDTKLIPFLVRQIVRPDSEEYNRR